MFKLIVLIIFVTLVAAQGHSSDDYDYGTPKLRVVNGDEANTKEFPYIVNLFVTDRMGNTTICGGSIIRSDAIITAAHCVDAKKIKVTAGITNRVFPDGSSQVLYGRKAFTRDISDHNPDDIALVLLNGNFMFNDYVKPISIAKTSDYVSDMDVVVAGWGRDRSGEHPDLLQKAQLKLLKDDDCKKYASFYSKNYVICAQHINKLSAHCKGDSGGPLVRNNVLVGTVRGGAIQRNLLDAGNGKKYCDPQWPGIYMKSTFYKNWISWLLSQNKVYGS